MYFILIPQVEVFHTMDGEHCHGVIVLEEIISLMK